MKFYGLFLFFSYTISSGSTPQELIVYAEDNLKETHGKIIHSSVLFRHGDRAIESPYPTDPTPASAWPDGYGQLSKLGKQQEYLLGEWIRQRYESNIIADGYKPDKVIVNSSDVDRTLMSAQLVLAGLFPPSQKEMWNNQNFTWQPIPVHMVPNEYDNILYLGAPCQRYDLEICLLNDSPELQAFYLEHKNLFEYASSHSGFRMPSNNVYEALKLLLHLYDDLFIESLRNLKLPAWTKKIYPEPLKSAALFRFSLIAYTHEMQRLKGGPLLGSIVKDMKKKRGGEFNQTLHLYSGHDTTISTLLATLGVYNLLTPPYSSSVLFELRQKEEDFVVTILYRNDTSKPPYLLKLSGCDEICTLDQFIHLTENKIPEDWHRECHVNIFEKLYHFNGICFIVFASVTSFLGIAVITVIRLRMSKRRYVRYAKVTNDILKCQNE